MKKYKSKIGVTSLLLAIVLLLGFILSSCQTIDSYKLETNEYVRTINTDRIYNTSVDSEIDAFLNQFDEYEYLFDDETGQLLVRETKYSDGVTDVYQTYVNYLDNDMPIFTIVINSYYDDGTVEESNYQACLYYEEEDDEFFVDFEGELISARDIVESDVLENCVAIVDDITIAVAILTVAAVIICYPVVKTIVSIVVSVIRSFFSWLRNIFVTRTTITTVVSYQIRVFDRDFELSKVDTADKPRDDGKYYLAIILGEYVYISLEEITKDEAIEILATAIAVYLVGDDGQVDYSDDYDLNTYTFVSDDARDIALQAAQRQNRSGVVHHYEYHGNNKPGVYFLHYHPGRTYVHGSKHSFYGIPQIRV